MIANAVTCQECGILFDANNAGLAYNMGVGPEYFCAKCRPPERDAEGLIALFKRFFSFKRDGEPR